MTLIVIQGCIETLLTEPNPKSFPNHNKTTSRIIETMHMVEEISPFQEKREMDEKNDKEKKTFIYEIFK